MRPATTSASGERPTSATSIGVRPATASTAEKRHTSAISTGMRSKNAISGGVRPTTDSIVFGNANQPTTLLSTQQSTSRIDVQKRKCHGPS